MKAPVLTTNNTDVKLVEPNVERDAVISLEWLEGEQGRNTLKLMGVADKHNKPSTLEAEKIRVKDFIEKEDQLNWMIEFNGKVIGSIWVDLEPTTDLPAPAIHIMIGDPEARGHGIGGSVTHAVVRYLKQTGHKIIYSRRLSENKAASSLLEDNGFDLLGDIYQDSDKLSWQNVVLDTESTK